MGDMSFADFLELLRVIKWPLTLLIALVLFRREVRGVLGRLRRGKFFGQELELNEETKELEKTIEAAQEAEPSKPLIDPAKDKNRQLAELSDASDKVSQFLREAARDKVLALLRIWIAIEEELRALVAVRGLLQFVPRFNIIRYLHTLVKHKAISQESANSILKFYALRNRVVHGRLGTELTDRELISLIDSGLRLVEILRSVPRETYKVHAIVSFFADSSATSEVGGARAVVLETTSPEGVKRYAAYPTTRDYEPGQILSWEWNLRKVWGPAWYRDVETGQVKKAWDSAGEFVGRPLETIE